jgi:hypothetical protein
MSLAPRAAVPVATLSPSAAALASLDPGATAPQPTIGPAPSAGRTPAPVQTFRPGEWRQVKLPQSGGILEVQGMWSVGGQFMVLAFENMGDGPGRLVLLSSTTGRNWTSHYPPSAIVELQAAAVIDDGLWFVARVAGVTTTTWELVGTTTGDEWQSFGATDGLGDDSAGTGLLARQGERWLAWTWRYLPNDEYGTQELRTSADGAGWKVAPLPIDDKMAAVSSFRIGGTLGVLAGDYRTDTPRIGILTTQDGKSWATAELSDELEQGLGNIVCATDLCIGHGQRYIDGVYLPLLATSPDGLSWTLASGSMPELTAISAVPGGFLGMGAQQGTAWSSSNGLEWERHVVLPEDGSTYVYTVAVNGDAVLGLGSSEGPLPNFWLGSLAELGGSLQ